MKPPRADHLRENARPPWMFVAWSEEIHCRPASRSHFPALAGTWRRAHLPFRRRTQSHAEIVGDAVHEGGARASSIGDDEDFVDVRLRADLRGRGIQNPPLSRRQVGLRRVVDEYRRLHRHDAGERECNEHG